ncbi:quinone-dependent dihydroorotate dehydrogenase [Gilvimarinus agarilyticus]|uniref:quinone-dependent dihydroorotate dehydrogenase n=1 Tax=Gilvimarinus sp. 2_MG-2023 TaxID=3062666 RepID=UPI001C084CD2|nr:quinone-dependent dihydroorotate dehydrogenase [Gilvimarinus sp. 2_MG-2023]MBU2887004.1 quinone-dependent dihydroorotate dehydrogenase [Gilvimarinus agarilyticus]MDO6571664.1 quinone-dependent dihydroorotate dehydrogenase [Gilvimarinus sp. 2_MG-2023]
MYPLIKKILFAFNPETSHELSLDCLGALHRLKGLGLLAKPVADNPVQVMGLTFANPVGLAAGLDKNGDYFNALGELGFGFVEIGTVTPLAQPGNPKPRLFRLAEHNAIINRMGFNNKGVDHLVEQVKRRKFKGILGINIGKNAKTPVENALDDYRICMQKVYQYADYITVNVSSPNTPGLRNLQFGDSLTELLTGIKHEQTALAQSHQRYVPIAVKIAPDMDSDAVKEVADTLLTVGLDGVIATNTTVGREGVEDDPLHEQAGGLSGKPVRDKSTQVIKQLAAILEGRLPIIGVGGIDSGETAEEKIAAGASLVQVYSGFIYRGPALIKECAEAIAKRN